MNSSIHDRRHTALLVRKVNRLKAEHRTGNDGGKPVGCPGLGRSARASIGLTKTMNGVPSAHIGDDNLKRIGIGHAPEHGSHVRGIAV